MAKRLLFSGLDRMANELGACVRSVQTWVDTLEELGLITVTRRRRRPNMYHLSPKLLVHRANNNGGVIVAGNGQAHGQHIWN